MSLKLPQRFNNNQLHLYLVGLILTNTQKLCPKTSMSTQPAVRPGVFGVNQIMESVVEVEWLLGLVFYRKTKNIVKQTSSYSIKVLGVRETQPYNDFLEILY